MSIGKYMLSTLDSFSIANFYIRKDRPRGHRYGKAPGCKEYPHGTSTCKEMSQKGVRQYLRQVHARQAFQERHDRTAARTEQVIIEMDKLANENHSFRVSKNEIEFYRGNWWLHSNVTRDETMR